MHKGLILCSECGAAKRPARPCIRCGHTERAGRLRDPYITSDPCPGCYQFCGKACKQFIPSERFLPKGS